MNERFVQKTIVRWLARKGYARNLDVRPRGEHGVDIKVRHNKYARYYLVEIKGDPRKAKHPPSIRNAYFVYAVGQMLIRMKPSALYWHAIGLPSTYRSLVFRRFPWEVSRKLRLNFLFVDKEGKVEFINWKKLKKGFH